MLSEAIQGTTLFLALKIDIDAEKDTLEDGVILMSVVKYTKHTA